MSGDIRPDTVIANGTVVTATDVVRADVAIAGGVVVAVGSGLFTAGAEVIDARGAYVMPGGVDIHTHIDTPHFHLNTADDFESGTIAAACGGTTTIVDFCQQQKGQTLAEAIAGWHARAAGKAAIDYGFHIIVADPSEAVFEELLDLPATHGITSFKVFMAYKHGLMTDDMTLFRVLEQAKAAGALVMVHAENGDVAYRLQERLVAEGRTAPRYHAVSRPPRVEAEATARAIALAEIVGTPLYIVHVTCGIGRLRGVPVLGETCTQYLYTSEDDLDRPDFEGAKYVFTPPPRARAEQEVLWRALADGTLSLVSSDHCSWFFAGQKDLGRDDFRLIPNGGPGVEERMTMVYQGVVAGRIPLPRFVDLVATTPARIFGLHPRKGTIAVGADADIVVWDPARERVLGQDVLHHRVDYSLYEGQVVKGAPRTVLLGGEVIVRDGVHVGRPGSGRYLRRARHGEAMPLSPRTAGGRTHSRGDARMDGLNAG